MKKHIAEPNTVAMKTVNRKMKNLPTSRLNPAIK